MYGVSTIAPKYRPPTALSVIVCLAVVLMVYVTLSLRKLACPGLSYDEVNWANIALGEIDDSWISQRIGNFPWLLALPYLGTLKGYLMRPVLMAFGASVTTVRVPGIIVGGVCLIGAFFLARKLNGGWKAALAVAWLLAINPEFIQRMRLDLGPVAIDFLCKTAALLVIAFLCETFSVSGLLGVIAISAFGLWNKLTFIWYVNAFAIAALLCYGKVWFSTENRRRIFPFAVGGLAFVGFLAYTCWVYYHWRLAEIHQGQSLSFFGRAAGFVEQLRLEFAGISSINFGFDSFEPVGSIAVPILKGGMILLGALSLYRRGVSSRGGPFFATTTLILLLEVAFTKAAVWPWHTFSIEPFATILLVEGARFVIGPLGSRQGLAAAWLLFCAATAQAGLVLVHLDNVICRAPVTGTGLKKAWTSMAIYPLADFVKSHPGERIVFLDWGFRTQLLLLDKNPTRTIDYDKACILLPQLLGAPETIFVVHTPAATVVPCGRKTLYQLAGKSGRHLRVIETISDGVAPVVEILRLDPGS